ncbi:hypothetical protein HK101_010035 [Irineochytrium annulatum]|nr:hypothetical protein HK101_010035 [Irineochytrium annulatum]
MTIVPSVSGIADDAASTQRATDASSDDLPLATTSTTMRKLRRMSSGPDGCEEKIATPNEPQKPAVSTETLDDAPLTSVSTTLKMLKRSSVVAGQLCEEPDDDEERLSVTARRSRRSRSASVTRRKDSHDGGNGAVGGMEQENDDDDTPLSSLRPSIVRPPPLRRSVAGMRPSVTERIEELDSEGVLRRQASVDDDEVPLNARISTSRVSRPTSVVGDIVTEPIGSEGAHGHRTERRPLSVTILKRAEPEDDDETPLSVTYTRASVSGKAPCLGDSPGRVSETAAHRPRSARSFSETERPSSAAVATPAGSQGRPQKKRSNSMSQTSVPGISSTSSAAPQAPCTSATSMTSFASSFGTTGTTPARSIAGSATSILTSASASEAIRDPAVRMLAVSVTKIVLSRLEPWMQGTQRDIRELERRMIRVEAKAAIIHTALSDPGQDQIQYIANFVVINFSIGGTTEWAKHARKVVPDIYKTVKKTPAVPENLLAGRPK